MQSANHFLVGGFNPVENYADAGQFKDHFSKYRAENKTCYILGTLDPIFVSCTFLFFL